MGTVIAFPKPPVRRPAECAEHPVRETREKTLADTLHALFPECAKTLEPSVQAPAVRRTFTGFAFLPVEYTIEVCGGTVEEAAEFALKAAESGEFGAHYYRHNDCSPIYLAHAEREHEAAPGVFCTVREHIPEQYKSATRWASWKVSR